MTERFIDKFFESLHKAEFDAKDKHESRDSFLLAALSILGTVGLYFVKLLTKSFTDQADACTIIFIVLSIIYCAAVARATLCVAMSIWPRIIAYPGHPEELKNYVEALRSHYVLIDPSEVALNAAIDKQMSLVARDQYARCAANNRVVNQRKLKWQTKAREAASFAIILMLLNAVPTFYVERTQSNIQDIRMTNWPKSTEPKEEISSND